MVEKIKALHMITVLIVVYAFVNAFLIGEQISPDFQIITLPFSYVTQYLATTLGLLMGLGFAEYFYFSSGEKGVGKFGLGSVVGLAMGVAGLVLLLIVLSQNYQFGNPTIDRYLGDYMFLGSFVIIIIRREAIFKFGKAVAAIGG